MEKLSSILKILNFLYLKPFHQIQKLWRHDEYYHTLLAQTIFLHRKWESEFYFPPLEETKSNKFQKRGESMV